MGCIIDSTMNLCIGNWYAWSIGTTDPLKERSYVAISLPIVLFLDELWMLGLPLSKCYCYIEGIRNTPHAIYLIRGVAASGKEDGLH
jgi:hypothetical protein